jgi:hypothetical protein
MRVGLADSQPLSEERSRRPETQGDAVSARCVSDAVTLYRKPRSAAQVPPKVPLLDSAASAAGCAEVTKSLSP